ncbi:hypothetical protein ACIGBL_07890 [Streptomyces sp. NPDC085614]|uniref:hypothetical protein n=1 Tax=unclassified Streptomyces TaxID=2593676 RepID=UPI0021C83BB1|nr:hypothetical protein [Streptomyces sp. ms191]
MSRFRRTDRAGGRERTGRARRAGRAGVTAAALVGIAFASGCGIRTTSVPVDAGAAPTRVACSVDGEDVAAQAAGVPVRVFLVCGSQLEAVERSAPLPDEKTGGDPVRTASALLAQLQGEPSESEQQAGFSTAVKGPLVVTGGHRGDPVGTLRLSRQPEDLTTTALSQIVCTFAGSSAGAGGDTVVLGGPGAYPPRRYHCTAELRERPDSAPPTMSPSAAAASPSGT